MKIDAKYITEKQEVEAALKIRFEVFVDEQGVPAEDEKDEFEEEARHFLALVEGKPAGTARWRFTDKGVKLERFAVLKPYRGTGVGASLVEAVLKDVAQHKRMCDKITYLNSQVKAVPFYAKFGFRQTGEPFDECGIQHYTMLLGLA